MAIFGVVCHIGVAYLGSCHLPIVINTMVEVQGKARGFLTMLR